MKPMYRVLGILFLMAALVACDDDTAGSDAGTESDASAQPDASTGDGEASIRVFHAAIRSDGNPDTGFGAGTAIELNVDVVIDGAETPTVSGLSGGEASARFSLSPGAHTVSILAAGTNTELFSGDVTVADGDVTTIIAYNAAADSTSETLAISVFVADENAIAGADDNAAFLAVHVDGNSQADLFRAYSAVSGTAGVEALGTEYAFEAPAGSGVYTVTDFTNSYLDPDAGEYDGGFSCATPDVVAGGAYILVWGTSRVALPGTTAGSSNAYVLSTSSTGPQTPIPCVPQP